MGDGQEDVAERSLGGASEGAVLREPARVVSNNVVAEHRGHPDAAQEPTLGTQDAVKEHRGGEADGAVDAVLDGRKDGNDDANEENEDLQGRDEPELIHGVGRGDQVAHGVDDDGGERCVRDVVEHRGQGVDGEEDHDGSDNTGKGSSHTGLGLDGGTAERTSSGISTQERTENIGHTNGHHLLGGVDGVVVDTAERLRDGDVLNQQDDDGGRQVARDVAGDGLVKHGDGGVLEACNTKVSYHHSSHEKGVAKKKKKNSPLGTSSRILNLTLSLGRPLLTSQLIMV